MNRQRKPETIRRKYLVAKIEVLEQYLYGKNHAFEVTISGRDIIVHATSDIDIVTYNPDGISISLGEHEDDETESAL